MARTPPKAGGDRAASQTLLASSLSAVQRLSTHVGALAQVRCCCHQHHHHHVSHRVAAQENTGLRQQLQVQLVSTHEKRALFAEGAVWMGRYASGSLDRLGEKVRLQSAAWTRKKNSCGV
jgi:hypothetical protein